VGNLARPVALGLASSGGLRDAVRASERARAAGLESVWFHESYFERDAVTFATAVAASVPDIGIALGAVNVNTRHAALLAMTVSALDDLAPGRIMVALGTALPLRLAQMGIAYDADEAIERIEASMSELRRLWSGEPLATADGVPELTPMFPPVHRTPLWVAGYRRPFHELAGRAADGYLARPAESLQGVELAVRRIETASAQAGRPPGSVAVGGYLLSLVDTSRRAALDRAKREPFVIYMLSVQSDIAMRRVGLEPELRHRVAAAWRAGDYHAAAGLIPDRLVDAFVLCGTREEVASRAEQYAAVGMSLPILQPVFHTDGQVSAVIEAARLYGDPQSGLGRVCTAGRTAPAASAANVPLGRRLRGLVEITRPFSLTASIVPVAAAGALAAGHAALSWPLLLASLLAAVLLQIGTNVVNEVYDVRRGIDSITSPRASLALVTGRVSERSAFGLAAVAFLLAAGVGVGLVAVRGVPLVVLGVAGLLGGWGYTAPPLQYKYRAMGLPMVFLLMGPLMVVGGYYAVTGQWSLDAGLLSLPIGLLVTAILHGNEWRDIGEDGRAGISTLSIRAGRRIAHRVYVVLIVGAYIALALTVAVAVLPPLSLLAVLSLPLLVTVLRSSELGGAGQQRAIAMIDLQTARLHATFGLLLVIGLATAAVWHP